MRPRTRTRRLVVHCSATPPAHDLGVAEIRRWHRDRGFADIGYHYVIRRDGTLEQGRPLEVTGAHAEGANHDSVGLCLVGGVKPDGRTPDANFTPAQYRMLEALLTELLRRYPGAAVLGHRDLPGVAKACPCFDVSAWWASH